MNKALKTLLEVPQELSSRVNYPTEGRITRALEAQALKTYPIAQKEERERIIKLLENDFALAPDDDVYLRILLRDTLDDLIKEWR